MLCDRLVESNLLAASTAQKPHKKLISHFHPRSVQSVDLEFASSNPARKIQAGMLHGVATMITRKGVAHGF